MSKVLVNAVGDACPIPVVKATQALKQVKEPTTIEVQVDNEVAVQNLTRLAQGKGLPVSSEKLGEKLYAVTMEASGPIAAEEDNACCQPDARGEYVVAIESDCMGRGDDALGHTLMKGFIFALSQQDKLPKTILFYNGGAKIPVEGSVSLEDLKGLEVQGVEILTCGTCLNFYGLTDKLVVGSVTNMYSIVEKLSGAAKVIKP